MYGPLTPVVGNMVVRKFVRKKKKNETEDALNKVMGSKELEIAAVILKELAERKERKRKIENREKEGKKTSQSKPKQPKVANKPKDDKSKRLKELAELNKMGILSSAEFEKLKEDLVN
ncbi:MAG: hypothetical protein NZ820_02185 [Dehalococcoidia bacterium]|nr:hypothetical protein [Dehalococcoidia bacterium]|tara:strand:+ start:106 stop:459 length:354 start_codon:yes stop_codon:yes gene_type:complete